MFDRLASTSKKDRAVATIREAIVSGRMQPGDPVIETRVARELGVSQPVVREALLVLEHQGFVRRTPYRGASVTLLTEADIARIQELRAELESLAAEWARARVTAADLDELRAHVDGMQKAAAQADLTRFNESDLAFHRALWRLSGNPYLADCLERSVVPLLTFYYLRSGRLGATHVRSVEDHRRIVAALADTRVKDVRVRMRSALSSLRAQFAALVAGRGAAKR
jgi:DNA-binding GntR family transcriptional regulator